MSSRGKKKTTMAKLSRESRLRERRAEKKAKKEARRSAGPQAWEEQQPLEEPQAWEEPIVEGPAPEGAASPSRP